MNGYWISAAWLGLMWPISRARLILYSICKMGEPGIRARICKRLRSPGIDSKESIPPGFVAWRAGTTILLRLEESITWNRSLSSWNVYKFGLRMRFVFGIYSSLLILKDSCVRFFCALLLLDTADFLRFLIPHSRKANRIYNNLNENNLCSKKGWNYMITDHDNRKGSVNHLTIRIQEGYRTGRSLYFIFWKRGIPVLYRRTINYICVHSHTFTMTLPPQRPLSWSLKVFFHVGRLAFALFSICVRKGERRGWSSLEFEPSPKKPKAKENRPNAASCPA